MKDRKTEVKWFSVPEWKEEEEYLRSMHKSGWKFTDITFPCFYHFEKCEPEDVIYQLDYDQEARKQKAEYVQMFEDCGWEYLLDFVGYSYFRKPVSEMQSEEEIFCDDESKLDMIKRVYKGRILPLVAIFFCIIIPQLAMQFNLNGSFSKGLFVAYCFLCGIYIILFVKFLLEYMKLKNK